MPLKFDRFRLLYPPRPRAAINPSTLSRYSGYWAQYKYNDVRTLVYVFPDRHVELYNRYKAHHSIYTLTSSMKRSILALPLKEGEFQVFDGGLMHRGGRIRDRIVLWDVLVHDGQYLLGTTYRERYETLFGLCGKPQGFESETGHRLGLKVNENLWLSQVFRDRFEQHYRDVVMLNEIEGLVLKDPNGKLDWGLVEQNNGEWMIRVRKPRADYAF